MVNSCLLVSGCPTPASNPLLPTRSLSPFLPCPVCKFNSLLLVCGPKQFSTVVTPVEPRPGSNFWCGGLGLLDSGEVPASAPRKAASLETESTQVDTSASETGRPNPKDHYFSQIRQSSIFWLGEKRNQLFCRLVFPFFFFSRFFKQICSILFSSLHTGNAPHGFFFKMGLTGARKLIG